MSAGMQFEWDERKAAKNRLKHGVSFEEASTAFGDPLSITIEDPLHSEDENRLVLIGKSEWFNTLVVVHLEKKDTIRIISARKASKKERKVYEEQ
jgi:uncharacterized DUF497 family protein